MAWYNETQPDWTEEGTQGMAMVDALKLMTALKGSQIEQLEKQTNTMRLLGLLGGEGQGSGASERMEQQLMMDAMSGNPEAIARLNQFSAAKSGQYKPSGRGAPLSYVEKLKEAEALESLSPKDIPWNVWRDYTPEEQQENARKKLMGLGLMGADDLISSGGYAEYKGGNRQSRYAPQMQQGEMGGQMNPMQMMLLQRLLGTIGR